MRARWARCSFYSSYFSFRVYSRFATIAAEFAAPGEEHEVIGAVPVRAAGRISAHSSAFRPLRRISAQPPALSMQGSRKKLLCISGVRSFDATDRQLDR